MPAIPLQTALADIEAEPIPKQFSIKVHCMMYSLQYLARYGAFKETVVPQILHWTDCRLPEARAAFIKAYMDQVSIETQTLTKRQYGLSSIQEQGIKLYNQALAGIKDSAIPISIGPHNLSMIQALTFPYEPETLAAADELFIYVPKPFSIAQDTIKLLDESFGSEEKPGFNPPQDAAIRVF
jgi:hypothetical protein